MAKKPVLIYERLLQIRAVKGEKSKYPGQKFFHNFSGKAKIYGLPNGDVLITCRKIK